MRLSAMPVHVRTRVTQGNGAPVDLLGEANRLAVESREDSGKGEGPKKPGEPVARFVRVFR